MDFPPKQAIKLLFSINVPTRLQPGLLEGFYGNGFVLAYAQTTVKDLTERPLWCAVKVVQKAKEILADEYIRSIVDTLGDSRRRPDLNRNLVISQWSRLRLMDVDFGWGKASHVGNLSSDIYCSTDHLKRLPEPILMHGGGVCYILLPLRLPSSSM